MSFATPIAALWLLLAVPIIALYILKVRLRRVPVSTMLFWRKIYDEKPPRSLWQNLRHLLSLLLQLLFLGLIVGALVDPHFWWESLTARKVVFILDASASMQSTDTSPTRFDRAKAELLTRIEGLRFRDDAAILVAGSTPRVACGLTGHLRTLREAAHAAKVTDGPARLSDSVSLARRLIGDAADKRIVVISDGADAEAEKIAGDTDVTFVSVGARTANVGVTRFQARRSPLDPVSFQALVEVTNSADEPVSGRLSVTIDGDPLDVIPLSIAPGETASRTIEQTNTTGGLLRAEWEQADSLALDNVAWAILPPRLETPVGLVTQPNLFIENVLAANPLVNLTVVRPPQSPPTTTRVAVFHRDIPKIIPPGPVLLIDPRQGCDLFTLGEETKDAIVTKQAKESPWLAHVRLDNVVIPTARRLNFLGECESLVSAVNGEIIYGVIRRASGAVVVLAVNIDEGDLALRTAFPIMATNAIGQLAGRDDAPRMSLATGDIAAIPSGPVMAEISSKPDAIWHLVSPEGERTRLRSDASNWSVGPFDHAGLWRIEALVGAPEGAPNPNSPTTVSVDANSKLADVPGHAIACNLTSRAESDLRTPQSLLDKPAADASLASLGGRAPWYYLAALAAGLLIVEWGLYQRRWIT